MVEEAKFSMENNQQENDCIGKDDGCLKKAKVMIVCKYRNVTAKIACCLDEKCLVLAQEIAFDICCNEKLLN